MPVSSGKEADNVFTQTLNKWYVSKPTVKEKFIRIELAGQFNIAMIYIVATKLLQFTLKLGKQSIYTVVRHSIGLISTP